MKIRKGFVTNSSSSSFIVLQIGDQVFEVEGDENAYGKFSIDELEEAIKKAKENNLTHFEIEGEFLTDWG